MEYKPNTPELNDLKTRVFKNTKNKINGLRGYQDARTYIIIGCGSIGKTFGWMKEAMENCYNNPEFRFAIFYENSTQVDSFDADTLLVRQIEEFEKCNPAIADWLQGINSKLETTEETDKKKGTIKTVVKSRTISRGSRVLGHLIPMAQYRYIKGKNYKVDMILWDEFIPEEITHQNKDSDKQYTSLLQSMVRDDNCRITLCANPISLNSPILTQYNFQHIKPGQTLYWKHPRTLQKRIVCHYIDNNNQDIKDYQQYLLNYTEAGISAQANGYTYRFLGVPLNSAGVRVGKPDSILNPLLDYNIIHGNNKLSVYTAGSDKYITDWNGSKHGIALHTKYKNGYVIHNKDVLRALQMAVTDNKIIYKTMSHYSKLTEALSGV